MKDEFVQINSAEKLIDYLGATSRFNGVHYFSQYTSIVALRKIIESGYWYLGNAVDMNDLYEYESFKNRDCWKNVFYASFITNQIDNMAMWHIYATPYSDGIRIKIPKENLLAWINNVSRIYEVDDRTNKVNESNYIDKGCFRISLHRVIYESDSKLFSVQNKPNVNFLNPYSQDEFIGYIKDKAWDYEKEARLRIENNSGKNFRKVAIKIDEQLLKSIEVDVGPLNTHRLISKELSRYVNKVGKSKFFDKVRIKGV